MAESSSSRYDVMLYGATGYTGRLCAEYIHTTLPRSLKWPVAGRNKDKLAVLVRELTSLDASRPPPGSSSNNQFFARHVITRIPVEEVATLEYESLSRLAQATKVVRTRNTGRACSKHAPTTELITWTGMLGPSARENLNSDT